MTRNIPACAGKPIRLQRCRSHNKEHPSVRGEKALMPAQQVWVFGTSPRARGKLNAGINIFTGLRNIPACAGKTMRSALLSLTSPEHPRVRGENLRSRRWRFY